MAPTNPLDTTTDRSVFAPQDLAHRLCTSALAAALDVGRVAAGTHVLSSFRFELTCTVERRKGGLVFDLTRKETPEREHRLATIRATFAGRTPLAPPIVLADRDAKLFCLPRLPAGQRLLPTRTGLLAAWREPKDVSFRGAAIALPADAPPDMPVARFEHGRELDVQGLHTLAPPVLGRFERPRGRDDGGPIALRYGTSTGEPVHGGPGERASPTTYITAIAAPFLPAAAGTPPIHTFWYLPWRLSDARWGRAPFPVILTGEHQLQVQWFADVEHKTKTEKDRVVTVEFFEDGRAKPRATGFDGALKLAAESILAWSTAAPPEAWRESDTPYTPLTNLGGAVLNELARSHQVLLQGLPDCMRLVSFEAELRRTYDVAGESAIGRTTFVAGADQGGDRVPCVAMIEPPEDLVRVAEGQVLFQTEAGWLPAKDVEEGSAKRVFEALFAWVR